MPSLPKRESLTVEFKSDPKGGLSDKAVTDAVVGLSNADGGTLYIGIEDSGKITGLRDVPDNQWSDPRKIVSFIAIHTVPSVCATAEILQQEEKRIAKVNVPQAFCIVASNDGKVLRRRLKLDGTPENVPLFPHEYASRLSDLNRLDFTAAVLPASRYDDLNSLERDRLRATIKTSKGDSALLSLADEDLDKALGLAVEDESGQLRPTVCGLLLIGKTERLSELIPTNGLAFQVFRGTDLLMNDDLKLPILQCLSDCLQRFRAFNVESEFSEDLLRVAVPDFVEEAFREGLLNAFSHRDYNKLGRIIIAINDLELSVTSPGSFISGVSLDNLLTVSPHGRNPRLADTLKRIGLTERTGRGVDRIFASSALYGSRWPSYAESTSEYVRLCIPRMEPDIDFYKLLNQFSQKLKRRLSLLELLLLSVLRREPRLSNEALSRRTHHPLEKVQQQTQQLVQEGLIESSGPAASPLFTLSLPASVMPTPAPVAAPAISLEQRVLLLAKENEAVSRADVCHALGLSIQSSYRLLSQMVKDGLLVSQGEKRGRRYRLADAQPMAGDKPKSTTTP